MAGEKSFGKNFEDTEPDLGFGVEGLRCRATVKGRVFGMA